MTVPEIVTASYIPYNNNDFVYSVIYQQRLLHFSVLPSLHCTYRNNNFMLEP